MACVSGRAHENFMSYMQWQVGRSSDDPNVSFNRYRENRGSTSVLTNGNTQQQYHFGPGCDVYFEIDQAQKKIISWRYEGSKETCYIVP